MKQELPSQTPNNYGDGLSIAFELVATPAIFGLLGFGLDRMLGTTPLFVIAFSLVSFASVIGLTIWRYDAEMKRADESRREGRSARGVRPARWERVEAELAAEAAAAEDATIQAERAGADQRRAEALRAERNQAWAALARRQRASV